MIQKTANNLLLVLLIVVVVFVSGDVLGAWDVPSEVRKFSDRITNTLSTTLGDTQGGASGLLARLFQDDENQAAAAVALKDKEEERTEPSVEGGDSKSQALNEANAPTETLPEASHRPAINQNAVIQPVIERIIETVRAPDDYVTQDEFARQLSALDNRLGQVIYGASYPAPTPNYASGGIINVVAGTSRLDLLTNIKVDGVIGLTDADIPDAITASGYLPISGGTLSGDLTISGDFTVSGAQTLSGAISVPYITAASTTASTFIQASTTRLSVFDTAYFGGTATSTFDSAGNLTVAGILGVGTTSPFATLSVAGSGYFDRDITASNLTATGTIQFGGLGADMVLSLDGSGNLVATATPQFESFNATSSSATSTIAGSLNVGSGGLVYDFSSGNVGVATTAPGTALAVSGTGNFTGLVTFESGLAVNSDVITDFTGAGLTLSSGALTVDTSGNTAGIGSNWTYITDANGNFITPSTTVGFISNASSTINAALTVTGGFTSPGSNLNSEVYGLGAGGTGANIVAIGNGASANGTNAVVIGSGASAGGGTNQVVIGKDAAATGNDGIAIGLSAVTVTDSIALGESADAESTSNVFVAGSNSMRIHNVYFGKGITDQSPTAFTINGTGGFGTNIAGADLMLSGGKGTGNAAGGDILFQTSDAGGSGSTVQPLSTKMIITELGNLGIGTTSPYATLSVVGEAVAEYFTATSTTATSTFGGGATFATGGGNVGIGTAAPGELLDINGGNLRLDHTSGRIIFHDGSNNHGDIFSHTNGTWGVALGGGDGGIDWWFDNASANSNVARASIDLGTAGDGLQVGSYGSLSSSPLVASTLGGGSYPFDDWGNLFIAPQSGDEIILGRDNDVVILDNGLVGIGTTTPNRTLSVDGSALVCGDGDSSCPQTGTDGDIYATSRSGGAIDIAEWIKVGAENLDAYGRATIRPGELVCASPVEPKKVVKCTHNTAERLLGVVSTKPHLTMGVEYEGPDAVRLALAGRVPVNVNLENGPIVPGDHITTSVIHGMGAKATSSGYTVGVALEPYSGKPAEHAEILVLVDLGYFVPPEEKALTLSSLTSAIDTEAVREKIGKIVLDTFAAFGVVIEKGTARFGNLFADRIEGQYLAVKNELCIGDTCVTEDELKALLSGSNLNGHEEPSSATPSTSVEDDTERPTISIHGANPAEVPVGAQYADNGATVADNVNDNLGYKTFLDGLLVSEIQLDTSTITTYEIAYVATDGAGNIATATRQVNIYDPIAQENAVTEEEDDDEEEESTATMTHSTLSDEAETDSATSTSQSTDEDPIADASDVTTTSLVTATTTEQTASTTAPL